MSDALGLGLATSLLTSRGIFTPPQISGLFIWFDASDLTTITESAGRVAQFDDKSGQGNHVSQPDAADQPFTGTRTLNGLNTIEFQGGNDVLFRDALVGGSATQPITCFVVSVLDNPLGQTYSFYAGSTIGDGSKCRFIKRGGAQDNFRMRNGIGTNLDGTTLADGDPHFYTQQYNGTSSTLWIDDQIEVQGNAGNFAPAFEGFVLGANQNLIGQNFVGIFGELLFYEGLFNSSQLSIVWNYLRIKWGI